MGTVVRLSVCRRMRSKVTFLGIIDSIICYCVNAPFRSARSPPDLVF